jgi:hypothetical protein
MVDFPTIYDRNGVEVKPGQRVQFQDTDGSHATSIMEVQTGTVKELGVGSVQIELDKPRLMYFRDEGRMVKTHCFCARFNYTTNRRECVAQQGDPFEDAPVTVWLEVV